MYDEGMCPTANYPAEEKVVLANASGDPAGTADKATVHTTQTPLHLAVSCYVFRQDGLLLVTRRALSKKAWPGVWTNSLCGHPGPGESNADAVRRRGSEELGLQLTDISLVLPHFRYRSTDTSGIVENEICPVFTAVAGDDPVPDPHEVAQWHWARLDDYASAVASAPWAFSPWTAMQLPQLKMSM